MKSQTKQDKKEINRGAWTADEDAKLAEVVAAHGAKRWKTVAAKAGLNRCGKSCRLRWMNYLRPNIKRGNMSDQEEDLILRLHKLLGNKWSLIARRLPGRTDNEIKNYWNSHLSKKTNLNPNLQDGNHKKASTSYETSKRTEIEEKEGENSRKEMNHTSRMNGVAEGSRMSFDVDEFFDFSNESSLMLEWMTSFLDDF